MERLTFKMREAFPPDDPIAGWVMNLSIALGDLRIVAKYATREEQLAHERIYFVRIFASHLREISKLLVLDYNKRQDVRDFVAGMPQAAQDARDEADRLLHAAFGLRPDVVVWEDVKRLRDDTFHYVSDRDSQARLVEAMRTVADMRGGEMESSYVLDDNGWLRAEYADLVAANRMHPFPQEHEDDTELPVTLELHEAIIKLNGYVATFIQAAEAHYLLDVLPAGVVDHHHE
ncbi:hypothetical protein LRS13_13455 [Svornostia abyssi]|uniref:HEPN AbiU2-like domain-containing protein n=1 Tax=Svornostia abyssi TaxID=2898438 RepID=A0ABY5PAN8_9ACTN|nr:hypothetical protein LRS13_13455 [Parviterribacteraceae bacterium J379]